MAWSSVFEDRAALNLDEFQRKQAASKSNELKSTVDARLLETWVWALVPAQSDPKGRAIEWSGTRVSGQDALAARVSKKLTQDESLMTRLGPQRLKLKLDEHIWNDAPHVSTKKLWEYVASYLFMPRIRDRNVLIDTVQGGISQLLCDSFAYAGRFDEATGRYEGLRLTGGGSVDIDSLSVLVKPDVARKQDEADRAAAGKPALPIPTVPGPSPAPSPAHSAILLPLGVRVHLGCRVDCAMRRELSMNLRMMLIFGARLRLPARLLGALPSRNSSAASEFLGGCRPHVRPLSDCAKSVTGRFMLTEIALSVTELRGCFTGVLEMASVITREIIETVAVMQAKALAFDSEHPNHALGARTAAEYGAAIRALVPEQQQLQVGELMLAAGAQAMRLLVLSCTNTRRAN